MRLVHPNILEQINLMTSQRKVANSLFNLQQMQQRMMLDSMQNTLLVNIPILTGLHLNNSLLLHNSVKYFVNLKKHCYCNIVIMLSYCLIGDKQL